MRLLDVPRRTRIRIADNTDADGEELNFHHIDGMYSYCTDDTGYVVHLRFDTPVEIVRPMPPEGE